MQVQHTAVRSATRNFGLFETSERELAINDVHEATAIYTTMSVVERLLDRLEWPQRGGRLLDPSAGDGAFLICAIARLAPLPDDVEALGRVRGYEIHPGAVMDARRRVADQLRMHGWTSSAAYEAAQTVVEERDFLVDSGTEIFSTVCGNPPYLRFARLPDYFKGVYGTTVAKHAIGDLLHAFLDRVCDVLTPDGVVALVTSDRWMFNQSAAALRREIGKHVALDHVCRLDASTSFYRPKIRVTGSLPRVHPIEVVMRRAGAGTVPITEAPISPDGYAEERWGGLTLDDVASIRLAPWLGPHGIFTIDAAQAAALPGAELVPVVDTDDVDPKTDKLGTPTRLAIRTQRDHEPTGPVADHLKEARVRMPQRGQRGPYWVPPEKLPDQSDEPALMVPRIAQRIRVIDLPAGTHALNHNLTILRRSTDGPTLDEIRTVLLSSETHEWIQRNASRLENNFYSITTSLLRRLPVRSL